MALFSAKDPNANKEKAPVNPGADSVSKDQAKTNEKVTLKKVNPDKEVSFYVPFAPEGKANIALPHPVLDKDGELTDRIEHKQIRLHDKFFTVLKKDVKNDASWKRMKELFIGQSLEMFSSVKNLTQLKEYRDLVASMPPTKSKVKNTQKIFGAFNPEHLSSELNFTIAFQCGEKARKFRMIKGRLFTSEVEMHKIFLKNGFQDIGYVKDSVKPSFEIKPKEESEEVE